MAKALSTKTQVSVIPAMRYRDAPAAIDWLCRAFGFERHLVVPDEAGGIGTQSAYIIVADADAHHDRAVAAGAKVVYPLFDADYGGRGYSCLDPEGRLWSFGTYDPWAES